MKTKLEHFFKLRENGTNISTELTAGLTTFMTMAYILAVNPNILSDVFGAAMDWGAVFTATALASALATLLMGVWAKYPLAIAPGMGLNAFFSYTVGSVFGWHIASIAVFAEGLIFVLLSLFRVREKVFEAIPKNLKYAIGAGIGLFIAFIGLVNGGVVTGGAGTPVSLGNLSSLTVILTLVGIVITMIFLAFKIKGALLWGILATWAIGIVCQFTGLYAVNPEIGMYSLIPSGVFSAPPSIAGYTIVDAFQNVGASFGGTIFDFIVILFAFLFIDVFDTVGAVIGLAEKAGLADKDGKIPRIREVFLCDASGTILGAAFGSSTATTYIESAAGVAEGGRTGLTSVTVAALFGAALFFSPVFSAIPAFATAPALVVIGYFMMESITKIDFRDITEGIPAFLTIAMMPLSYSIAEGIIFGLLSYVILKLATGRHKEISAVMLIVSVLFALRLVAKAFG